MKRRRFIQKSGYLFTGSILTINSPLPLQSASNTFFKRYFRVKVNGEKLYNGIILPETWPPMHLSPESDEPMPVPYLQNPPEVIPIDIGRQLFVDDFLIESTTLDRSYHQAVKFDSNPVFKPLSDDEVGGPDGKRSVVYTGHGGVFYDFKDKVFKMFYRSGWLGGLALAISRDMVHWERPELNLAGENLLLPKGHIYTGKDLTSAGSDNSVWLDSLTTNESDKIKFLTCWIHAPIEKRPKHTTHTMHISDGKNWSNAHPPGKAGDYCSIFYNPFRNVWVSSIRISDGPRGRCRYYYENQNYLDADWSKAVYWTNVDKFDKPEPEGKYPGAGETPQLYSLNAIAYESIMIGMHQILRGPSNAICDEGNFPKLTDLEIGFSRDGFHWFRPDKKGFIKGERTEGTWDRAYIHSTTGVFVVLHDKLIFQICLLLKENLSGYALS